MMITDSEFLQAARIMQKYCNEKNDSKDECQRCPFYSPGSVCGAEDVPTEWALPPDAKDVECEENEDVVNHPAHYTQGGVECIDAIKAAVGDGFEAYCAGNVLKYVFRYRYKGGVEDLKKARWYLDRLIAEVEGGGGDG